jgi:hypothetical protein
MKKSTFYYAGCLVCISAEHDMISLIGAEHVEIIHLGNDRNKIEEAERAGVKSLLWLLPTGMCFILISEHLWKM